MGELQTRTKDRKTERVERALTRLRSVGELMDDKFEIPLVKVKVGLDPILGLIPGGGDWVSWVVSVYIVVEAARLGVPPRKLISMGWHITVDLVVGYVPGVGDIFDVLYKANRRNVTVILDHFGATVDTAAPGVVTIPGGAPATSTSHPAVRWGVAIVLVLFSLGLAALPFIVIWWLIQGAS